MRIIYSIIVIITLQVNYVYPQADSLLHFIDIGPEMKCFDAGSRNLVINNYKDYENMFWEKYNLECENAKLPYIDFSKYTLLYTAYNVNTSHYTSKKKIIKYPKQRKLIVKINISAYYVHSVNKNLPGYGKEFLLIPKNYSNYDIEFQR